MSTDIVRASCNKTNNSSWNVNQSVTPVTRYILTGTWLFGRPLDSSDLKVSLSRLLDFYPQVAGRFVNGKQIANDNSGVPFTIRYRRDLTIKNLVENHSLAHRLGEEISWRKVNAGKAPCLNVTLTYVKDGSALTVEGSHALMDGTSFYGLVRDWGLVHTGKSFPLPELKHEAFSSEPLSKQDFENSARKLGLEKFTLLRIAMSVLKSPLGILSAYRLRYLRAGPIYFSEEDLERIKSVAAKESGRRDLTDLDVLVAHISQMCVLLFSMPEKAPYAPYLFVDLRGRVRGVPENFFGNAVCRIKGPECRVGDTLGNIAGKIHEHMRSYLSRPSAALATVLSVTRGLGRPGEIWIPPDNLASITDQRNNPPVIGINSFANSPIYDVDFGDELQPSRPDFVVPHINPNPIVFWPASPKKGGVEVYFHGVLARAINEQKNDSEWWRNMLRFREKRDGEKKDTQMPTAGV